MQVDRQTRVRLNAAERAAYTDKLFVGLFDRYVFPLVTDLAARLSDDYRAGSWQHYALYEEGWYTAPLSPAEFRVRFADDAQASISADAFGIAASLHALLLLSFSGPSGFPEACARSHRLLLRFARRHPEARLLLRATY
jgi:hypothetical protein